MAVENNSTNSFMTVLLLTLISDFALGIKIWAFVLLLVNDQVHQPHPELCAKCMLRWGNIAFNIQLKASRSSQHACSLFNQNSIFH